MREGLDADVALGLDGAPPAEDLELPEDDFTDDWQPNDGESEGNASDEDRQLAQQVACFCLFVQRLTYLGRYHTSCVFSRHD